MRQTTPEESEKGKKQTQLVFELNHTMPYTDRYNEIVQKLFKGNIGSNVMVNAPLTCVCADMVKIGDNVVIMNNCLMMSRGGLHVSQRNSGAGGLPLQNDLLFILAMSV